MKKSIIIFLTIIIGFVPVAAQSYNYPVDQNKKKEKKIIKQVPKKQKTIIKKSKTEVKKKKPPKKKKNKNKKK